MHLTGELVGGGEVLKSFNCSLGRRHLTLLFARLSLDNKFEILIRRESAGGSGGQQKVEGTRGN